MYKFISVYVRNDFNYVRILFLWKSGWIEDAFRKMVSGVHNHQEVPGSSGFQITTKIRIDMKRFDNKGTRFRLGHNVFVMKKSILL